LILIVLVVIETMALFLWLLALMGASPQLKSSESWCAFFAVLVLAVVVFLLGSGVIVWQRGV